MRIVKTPSCGETTSVPRCNPPSRPHFAGGVATTPNALGCPYTQAPVLICTAPKVSIVRACTDSRVPEPWREADRGPAGTAAPSARTDCWLLCTGLLGSHSACCEANNEEAWARGKTAPGSPRAPGARSVCVMVRARNRQTPRAACAGNRSGPRQRRGHRYQRRPRRQASKRRRPAGEPAGRLAAVSRVEPEWGQHRSDASRANLAAGATARGVGD